MDEKQLRAAGAPMFYTRGPDSGGYTALFCHDGRVYWYTHEGTSSGFTRAPMSYGEFLERYGADERRGYAAAARHIRDELD